MFDKLLLGKTWPAVLWSGSPPHKIVGNREWIGRLAWAMRPGFVSSGNDRKRRLFAGPWVGEFGWELLGWQGLVRALRPYYDHVTVCARASSAALYADCCDTFIPHQIQGQSNAHVVFNVSNPGELTRTLDLVPVSVDHLKPLRYVPIAAQSFVRFGDASLAADTADILLHARGSALSSGRNWPHEKWVTLVETLKKGGYHVGAIGLRGTTFDIEGVADYRNEPLEKTMNRIAAAKLVIGPSSGPMHLASLCGTPHLVWTDRRTYSMRRTSRSLYEQHWNPFRAAVFVLDEYAFNPSVDAVIAGIHTLLPKTSVF